MADVNDSLRPFDALLWQAAESNEPGYSLREAVSRSFRGERGDQLTVTTVIADGVAPVDRLTQVGGRTIIDVKRLGEADLLLVGDGSDAYVVSVWPAGEAGVSHVVGTAPFTDDRWERVERWLARSAPALSHFFLNEADFDQIGKDLSTHGRVEASRMTARAFADGSSYHRGWSSDKHRPRPTYRQVMREIERFAAVKTLTLHVADKLTVYLRRHAGATYTGGSFGLFEELVLSRLALAGAQRRDLLTDRARKLHEPVERAIAIRLPPGAFAEPDAVTDALEALNEQRATGVAVLHRNPYLHVAVTDYLDGSNFDAFITSDDELVIFPGYRASVGALTRLTDHLGERLGIREVADVPATAPATRKELLTNG